MSVLCSCSEPGRHTRTHEHRHTRGRKRTVVDWHPNGPCNPLGCNLCLCAVRLVQILNFCRFKQRAQELAAAMCATSAIAYRTAHWDWPGPRSKVKRSSKKSKTSDYPGERRRKIPPQSRTFQSSLSSLLFCTGALIFKYGASIFFCDRRWSKLSFQCFQCKEWAPSCRLFSAFSLFSCTEKPHLFLPATLMFQAEN